jgi:hypothetical protein
MSIFNPRNIVVGILATVAMDVLSTVSVKLRLIAPLSPRLIGRWFACDGIEKEYNSGFATEQ